MSVTMEQVRAALYPDEVDYIDAAKLGTDAIPHLRALAAGIDPMLASKAVYLASRINHERSMTVLEDGAQSCYPAVRVAAAAAVRDIRKNDRVVTVLRALLADVHTDVRRIALGSVAETGMVELIPEVKRISSADPDRSMQMEASSILDRFSQDEFRSR